MNNAEIIKKFAAMPNGILAQAWTILMGDDWKTYWTQHDKAYEMRSIFNEGTMPCVPFSRWMEVTEFIRETVEAMEDHKSKAEVMVSIHEDHNSIERCAMAHRLTPSILREFESDAMNRYITTKRIPIAEFLKRVPAAHVID